MAPETPVLLIESFSVTIFRGLSHCVIELEPSLTVLVGRNNAGKSRLMRALAVALGHPAEEDDLTVGHPDPASIDVVVAPIQHLSPAFPTDETFEARVRPRLGRNVAVLSEEPVIERFAWRTTIRRSADGRGARSDSAVLTFDAQNQRWDQVERAAPLTRDMRGLLTAEVVNTSRDVADDLYRRGSAIRRLLTDLEIPADAREELESKLHVLGKRIVTESGTLDAIHSSLVNMNEQVGGLGAPSVNPLPVRLEELARSATIELDSGNGSLPVRLHGSGARSLASLQVQGVHYERRVGHDGPSVRPWPITLVEEPESHLHPQATLRLSSLLEGLPGQVIVSTHSAHLASSVAPQSVRVVRSGADETKIVDLGPASTSARDLPRSRRKVTHTEAMEKLKRLVERPFGELIFAEALLLGDGATERAFLPVILDHALGARAHGVTVVDPGSLATETARAALQFAAHLQIPWLIFADSDEAGVAAATALDKQFGAGDGKKIVWICTGDGAKGAAIEQMMVDFDDQCCRAACLDVRPDLTDYDTKKLLKQLKGSVGSALGRALIATEPDYSRWPPPLKELIGALDELLEI